MLQGIRLVRLLDLLGLRDPKSMCASGLSSCPLGLFVSAMISLEKQVIILEMSVLFLTFSFYLKLGMDK